MADSGYESLANYRWLFENGQTAFIKPANYESGKKRSSKSQVGRMENMGYYEPDDCFICKNGRHLDLSSHYTSHAKDGTERKISVYRCEDCSDCPYRAACCKAKDSERLKEIFVCWEFQNLRNNSYHNITTEEGKLLRCNRSIQAEGAFGQLKHTIGISSVSLPAARSKFWLSFCSWGFPKTLLICWQSATVDCKICI